MSTRGLFRFTRGDWNGFWALFADNLANMVIAAGVLAGVFKFPEQIVFGRVLPGLGVSLVAGLGVYAYLALRLARVSGRDDVTALPYGISTPVMFVYLFGVMGPVYFKTHDPVYAYRAGLGAALVGGIIEIFGAWLGPLLRKITPRAGMLGTLAGIAIAWIAAVPLGIIFEHPLVGLPSLFLVLVGLIGRYRLPLGLPAGLAAILLGTAIGFLTGDSRIVPGHLSLNIPIPLFGDLVEGIRIVFSDPMILMIVLPIEIYNFIETMNNVESSAAAGDEYPVGTCQAFDGVGTCIGALFGSPFPTTVYIGHPAYKKLGARVGYGIAVGMVFFCAAIFGVVGFLRELVPEAAVAPLLVFVGVVITTQAFRATPVRHGIAVAVAMVPHIADVLNKQLTGVILQLQGPGWEPGREQLFASLAANQGVHIKGYGIFAGGAIVVGLLWGSIVAFLVEGKLRNALCFGLAAFLLALFGIIHSSRPGLHWTAVTQGYLVLVVILTYCLVRGAKQEGDPEGE